MTDDSLISTLRDFVARSFVPDERPENLPVDLDLIRSGILNSLAVIHTSTFLEELIGDEVGPHELTPKNIGSIAAMAEFVRRRRAES